MKSKTLPIKRRPVQKGVLHKLSAVTRSRKQRVAAAPTVGEMDTDEGSSRISRALTIIFLIHIVAVGLIFFHKHFLDGRGGDSDKRAGSVTTTTSGSSGTAALVSPAATQENLPRLSNNDTVYVVKPGDNYTRIADREGVTELALREANHNVEIRTGLILSVPPRRVVAEEPVEVAQIRERIQAPATAVKPEDDGLVAAVDIKDAPRALMVEPATSGAPGTASGATHTVQKGETIWRICQKYGVKQDEVVKLNKIADPSKVRVGMKLVIPN